MPHVSALSRYPVKGFTAESVETIDVQADGRVAGDRVLAFRFADGASPEVRDGLDYWPKINGLALMEFPALAALRLSYDDEARRVRITRGDALVVDAGIDEAGRRELEAAVTDYVLSTDDAPRLQRAGRLPIVLRGDGVAARFQDRARGFVTLHGAASARAVGDALEQPIDDRRFRSNIVVEGLDAWDELDWRGEVRIGDVRFTVAQSLVRCLATHANPDTGIRDARVMKTLTGAIGQPEPTLGIALLPVGDSGGRVGDRGSAASDIVGRIRIGDEVSAA